MIAADEDALMCDFAETYHIYDFRALPVQYAAALACGLRPDSRIKMLLSGAKAPSDIVLSAAMVDRLSLLVWAQSKDASKGRNRPKSLLDEIYKPEKNAGIMKFETGVDFDAAWKKATAGGE